MEIQDYIDTAIKCGSYSATVIDTGKIVFRHEFREACESNLCGKFGRCWMCPPDIGGIDELMAKAKGFKYVLVFQSIGALEDSFDIEGMQEAAIKHNKLVQEIAEKLTPIAGSDSLMLGAGGCNVCERCAKMDNNPCRHPEKAIPSLEAHGIAVSELAAASGMNYTNGQNTVTYFGGFLF